MNGPLQVKPVLLVFPFGLLSHYLRCIVLCRYLRLYFDIRILHNSAFASFIEDDQFDTFACQTIDAQFAVESVKRFEFGWMNEFDLERTYRDEVHVINQFKPIAVLGDHTPTLKMSAEAAGVRFVSVLNGYLTPYYAGHRSISRTHPAYTIVKMLPASLEKLLTKQGEKTAFTQIHKPFRRIRERHNLTPQKLYSDELEGELTLVCDLPELFPQNPAPPGYLSIGPLCYGWSTVVNDRPGWLDGKKKTLFASMGSTGDWQKISFLNDPLFAQYNVIAAGDKEKVLYRSHISHLSFANFNEIFPFTDLVICHGGNGTIYQALLHEIPLLCKTSHCDQEWNVAAVENNQLGKNIDGISVPLDYYEIVSEWIEQKGSKQFKHFSNLIKLQGRQLSWKARLIADIIQKKNLSTPKNTRVEE